MGLLEGNEMTPGKPFLVWVGSWSAGTFLTSSISTTAAPYGMYSSRFLPGLRWDIELGGEAAAAAAALWAMDESLRTPPKFAGGWTIMMTMNHRMMQEKFAFEMMRSEVNFVMLRYFSG